MRRQAPVVFTREELGCLVSIAATVDPDTIVDAKDQLGQDITETARIAIRKAKLVGTREFEVRG